VGDSEADAIPS